VSLSWVGVWSQPWGSPHGRLCTRKSYDQIMDVSEGRQGGGEFVDEV
jgi:hypothetical protein